MILKEKVSNILVKRGSLKNFFNKDGYALFNVVLRGNVEVIESIRADIDVQGNAGEVSSNQGDIKARNIFGDVKTNQGDVICDVVGQAVQSQQGKILQKEVSGLDMDCVFEDDFVSKGSVCKEAILKVMMDGEMKEFKVSSVKIDENSLVLNSDLEFEFDDGKEVLVCIDGDLQELVIDKGSLNISGSAKSIATNQGDVMIKGDVASDVETNQGDADCEKVLGSIYTRQGDIECGRLLK